MAYTDKNKQRLKYNEWYSNNKPKRANTIEKLKKNFNRIKKLYLINKAGTSRIAKLFKTHATSIKRILLKNNVKLRSDSEARKLVRGKENCNWTGYKDITGTTWARIVGAAKKRNMKFNITIKQAYNLWKKQKGICALSGDKLKFAITANRNPDDETASLDRIDSSKGYIISNVQWIHKKLNLMKREIHQIDFINWCNKVTKYQESV